jgi:hypothetical protein
MASAANGCRGQTGTAKPATERTTMRHLLGTAISLALIASTAVHAESTQIMPGGSRPSAKGPEANFTGSVVVDPLYPSNEHTSNTGGHVTFEPGARSAWHTHPAGQVLIVTSGTGWVQEEGGRKAGHQARRRHLDTSRHQALARRDRQQRHEPHGHYQYARRQERRLDGEGHGRAVSGWTVQWKHRELA